MKVGLLTSWVSHRGGGVVDVVRRLAPSLRYDEKLEVSVIGLAGDSESVGSADWNGISVAALSTRGPRAWGYAPKLSSALAASNLDLLHVHGIWMYPSMASLGWARATVRPYMITPHGMLDPWAIRHSHWKKRAALWAFEREHLGGAACLHSLCEAEVEAIRALGLRNAICIIPNGVSQPETPAAGKPGWHGRASEDAKILLYLGRLHPKKGLVNLLLAWQRFDRRADAGNGNWHLTIAGWDQNGHEAELRQLVKRLSISESVRFPGPKFGSEKDALLRSATAFVLPSFSEGLPMAVLEAWSYRLPVLMTRHCNLPEGFHAGAALEIEADCDDIRRGLDNMAGMNDQDRCQMGLRGAQLCSERFSQQQASAMIAAVYRWLLGRGPRPACVVTD